MALICNGTRYGHTPHKYFGGDASIYVNPNVRNLTRSGMQHNLTTGYGITEQKIGVPSGNNHPYAWILFQKVGGIGATNNCLCTASQYGKLTKGMPISSHLVCDASTVTGVIGQGVAISAHMIGIASTLYGKIGQINNIVGSCICDASIVTGDIQQAVAIYGSTDGTCTISGAIDGDGWLYGAVFGTCSLSLVSYATGTLNGVISPYTILSPESLANAVWSDTISKYPDAGTTGKALASAGSAGDPWGTMLPGLYPAGTAGYLVGLTGDISDAVRIIKGLSHENFLMKDQVFDGSDRLLSATVRIYDNATDCAGDTNWIEEYSITSSYGTTPEFRMVKL